MWCVAVACVAAVAQGDTRPGGIIRVNKPGDVLRLPEPEKVATDCQGCGAPLKAYIHHCEYCRREK